jgi:dual specificity MAP kinase phosphatase
MNIVKAWNILVRRVREQGLWTTVQWAWGRGIPKLTGVPLFAYSRITPQLYVGPQYGRRGRQALQEEGITGVVNMRVEYDDAAHGLALERYCHLPTVDDDSPSAEHLQKGVDFITGVVAEGGKVYIHCKGGIGRAPTMAAAYLVSQGMGLDDALATIKQARPFIHITSPQMAALRRYAAVAAVPAPAAPPPVRQER